MASSPSLDLFVSHSSVDADLVEPLVDLLQDALGLEPDRIRATSIDGYRLPAGIPFEEALRRETHDASAFIGVISPASLKSTYVAFELGSRWGANRQLVPLLTPEVTAGALQGPLATLNAMSVDDRAQMQQLIDNLATELNIKARAPHQYGRQLERLLTAAAHRSQPPPKDARPDADGAGDSDQTGRGDSIQSTITGNVSGQVAVGKGIQQRQTIAVPERPTEAELKQLRAAFAELKALVQSEAPPDNQAAAAERLAELEQATMSEKPDVSTMEYVRNWFLKNLPKLAGAVTRVVVNPVVGKLVEASGDTVAEEFRRRFGRQA